MKNIICLIILFIAYTPILKSQTNDEIAMSLHYIAKFRITEENPKMYECEKVLDIGKTYSVFYDLWNTGRGEARDSVLALGGSFAEVMGAVEDTGYPRSKQDYKVYKNVPVRGKLTYTDKIFKVFKYEEDMECPKWEILDGDSIIYDYKCQKAQTKFRGRTWTVWFTPEIPISDGPWKLYGLPGVILKANDSTGAFSFDCIGIKKGNGKKMKRLKGRFINCSRKKLNELIIEDHKDPYSIFNRLGIKVGPGYTPDGKLIVYEEEHAILLELE